MKSLLKRKEQTADQPETASQEQAFSVPKPKKKSKLKKRLIILGVIVAVFVFLFYRCSKAGNEFLSSLYLAQPAQMRDMTVFVSATGTVTPAKNEQIVPLATGEVIGNYFEEGDWVEKGQILYHIDDTDAKDALLRAQLSYEQAKLSYDSALLSVQLEAGCDGTVQKFYVKDGDTVSPGAMIADVQDKSTLRADIPFHSQQAQNLWVGQQVQITVEQTMETLSGTIESISAAENLGLGNVLLREVTVVVKNPGALASGTAVTAMAGDIACAGSGTLSYNQQKTITAMAGGEVTLLVKEGAAVSRNTYIASIGGSSAQSTVKGAQLSLESARMNLDAAQRALENYTVTAPVSGLIVKNNFACGDTINTSTLTAAGGVAMIIYDTSFLQFEMDIDERDINKVKKGQLVTLTSDGVEGETFSAVVDHVGINGRSVSGVTTYPVTVRIDECGALLPAMNVSAQVLIEKVGQVLCVPVEAVKRGASPTVSVIPAAALDENGMVKDVSLAQSREVTLGRNDDLYIEITSGLSEGEIVIYENTASNNMMMFG